jgi:hypothetical protein
MQVFSTISVGKLYRKWPVKTAYLMKENGWRMKGGVILGFLMKEGALRKWQ